MSDRDDIPAGWDAFLKGQAEELDLGKMPADHLLDILQQADRRLLEARMLPTDRLLTEEERSDLRAHLADYIARNGIKHAEVARQLGGVAGGKTTSISEILSGKYGKRVKTETYDAHLRQLNTWMEVDARRRAAGHAGKFVETTVAKRMLTLAEKTVSGKYMSLIHGPSGIGKSMVARAIVDRYPGAIYLRISRGNTTHTAIRRLLGQAVGTRARTLRNERSGMTHDELIFTALRGTGRVLVVDEAHRLADGGLEFLRDVYDEAEVPILLIATKALMDRIENDKDEDRGQLYSRFAMFLQLNRKFPDEDDKGRRSQPLFSLEDIRKLYESDRVRLTIDAQRFLQGVANRLEEGSLRRCNWIVRWAESLERALSGADAGRVTLNAQHLRDAELKVMDDDSVSSGIKHRVERIRATA